MTTFLQSECLTSIFPLSFRLSGCCLFLDYFRPCYCNHYLSGGLASINELSLIVCVCPTDENPVKLSENHCISPPLSLSLLAGGAFFQMFWVWIFTLQEIQPLFLFLSVSWVPCCLSSLYLCLDGWEDVGGAQVISDGNTFSCSTSSCIHCSSNAHKFFDSRPFSLNSFL